MLPYLGCCCCDRCVIVMLVVVLVKIASLYVVRGVKIYQCVVRQRGDDSSEEVDGIQPMKADSIAMLGDKLNTLDQIILLVSSIDLEIAILVFAANYPRFENARSISAIEKKSRKPQCKGVLNILSFLNLPLFKPCLHRYGGVSYHPAYALSVV
jgi:hypothetical protein